MSLLFSTIHLLNKSLYLEVHPQYPAPSSDSVWVSSAVETKDGDKILDAGCGCGAVGLCILARQPNLELTFTDIVPELIELTSLNISANGFDFQAKSIVDDITSSNLQSQSFDHVVTNPPFYDRSRLVKAQSHHKEHSHGITSENISKWLSELLRLTKDGGTINLIQHTDNIDLLLRLTQNMARDLIWIQTSTERKPKRFILRIHKGQPENLNTFIFPAYEALYQQAISRDKKSMWDILRNL